MQDSRKRNARNGFESAIIEKISDFFRKITEVSGGVSMQDSRARNARNGFEGAIIEKISDFFPKNYRSFRGGGFDARFSGAKRTKWL